MKIIEKYKLIAPFPRHTVGQLVVKKNSKWFFENKDVEVPSYLLADESFFEPVYKEISEDYYYVIENEIAVLDGGVYTCIGELKRKRQFNLDVIPHASFLKSDVIKTYYYIKLDEQVEIKEANSLDAGYNLILYFKRKEAGNCFASKEEAEVAMSKIFNLLKEHNARN